MSIATDHAVSASSAVMLLGDLSDEAFERAIAAPVVGWDIETTGLDWRDDRISLVQIRVGDTTFVVRVNGHRPPLLVALLEDPAVGKVLHHAMFDLRFMVHQWRAAPAAVACTKIAAKLAYPGAPPNDYSLAALVERFFGAQLDKTQRTSDWEADQLDPDQMAYAAADVEYLWRLYEALDAELRRQGRIALRDRCYAHLTTRVELELGGYGDVFDY